MNLHDISIVIDKKVLKENSAIVKVLTKNYGIYSGVAKIKSKKNHNLPEKTDFVDFFWQARLAEHIGSCKLELIEPNFSLIMMDKKKIYSVNAILDLINLSFRERDPHPLLFNYLEAYLKKMSDKKFTFLNHILMEINILSECGYGLDLTKCAKTELTTNLTYVSPKSGKAVSQMAGEEYKKKLLKLPKFILNQEEPKTIDEIHEANLLTRYFFDRYVISNNQNIKSRDIFYNFIIFSLESSSDLFKIIV